MLKQKDRQSTVEQDRTNEKYSGIISSNNSMCIYKYENHFLPQ